MNKIGITTINGYPLTMDERMEAFRNAGFHSILLWWGDDEIESKAYRVALADKYNLMIENVHASTDGLNSLWIDSIDGESIVERSKNCILECNQFNIRTMVMHLTNGSNPPPVSRTGIYRMEKIIECAENNHIVLAIENMRVPEHVKFVLDTYPTPCIKFCYDSGHEHYWSPNINWLSLYGDRVGAIHLSDNVGNMDSHLIPFDGNVKWQRIIENLSKSSYTGTITIEAEKGSSNLYDDIELDEFLVHAYKSGLSLYEMINNFRIK
ncbi:sugar phosphate isomerase/epimerase [Clostridium estertheticum]|uniref:sugar phosphate isomerase/epimerase family protein n=1 Tax=Clostridium estertheticum TaxID=238834 RepID=UPI0013E993F7|nr:sugar phosphate isomerase/epimerase [Clostridium estertheticum]MBZ9689700.1 sugar phosphate isomerase/epimerase [Clostridium estertheticum]